MQIERTPPSPSAWHPRCAAQLHGGAEMVMFKRSQIYIGLGLAAVVELIIRVVAH